VDWRYLLDLAAFHGIIPFVIHNLDVNGFSSQIPQPYLNELKQIYHGTVYRNLILSSELAKILSIFSQHGIETICLKGAPLAESLYRNPILRHVGDMDILVHPEDISKAVALLAEQGYKQAVPQQGKSHPFHGEPYLKKASFPLAVELHWGLDDSKLVDFPKQEIWCRAQPLQFEGVSTLVLSPEDNLLFLANHLSKHNFQLLKLVGDITELLKKYEQSLDWDYIMSSTRSWKMEPAVYCALQRAGELLGAPVPAHPLEAIRPSAWRRRLLDFLVSKKTFVSPIKGNKLRSETSALARSLMMKGPREMLTVLSNHRGSRTGKAWLRTAFWIMVVFAAGIVRNWTGTRSSFVELSDDG
jgi:hypothetical protein